MNINIVFLLLAASVASTTGYAEQKAQDAIPIGNAPAHLLALLFPEHDVAILNGAHILDSINKGESGTGQELWGQPVAFYGGIAPPGGNANLMVADDILLSVDIIPSKDVRPHAVAWSAVVLGTLKYIDPKMRIIYIEVKPEYWIVIDTT